MSDKPSVATIRTLLLTDLCDSVSLVERIGDQAAAELFRAHDSEVLALQQRWQGRLIDRSDGLLLLFERPLHGIGFAVDYLQAIAALGKARGQVLTARAGLHVGEVLLWNNPRDAVRAGAKPLEVEGLAKPMTARLMALARPGQILVSAVAEALARRSARDDDQGLGERLVWKSHGRWHLKGVPTAQEVLEVGLVGHAPLRMPATGPKAWRDLPLWRRPAALVLQAVLLAGVGIGSWMATRSEPALAFAQRDWVVLADLRNSTSDRQLDEPLEMALRLSMEQSPYVNLLSSLKVNDSLQRMRRPFDSQLDRNLASEVALRDGARAVIVPVLAEVGGRLRLSAEVIDPLSRTVVYVESVDSPGRQSLLESVDTLSALLRGRLGEAVRSIEQNARPLPEVTTANLDALRAYALAEDAYGRGNYRDSLGLYEQALELDGEFALALLGKVRALNITDRIDEAGAVMDQLETLSGRMPSRELMYYRAWRVQLEQPDKAFERWSQMSQLYPDFHQAFANAAFAMEAVHYYPEGLPYSRRASEAHYAFAPLSQETWARMAIGNGTLDEASVALERAAAAGLASVAVWQSNLLAVKRNFAAAKAAWPGQTALVTQYFDRSTQLLDEGLAEEAVREMELLVAQTVKGSARRRQAMLQLAVARMMAGQTGVARREAGQLVDAAMARLASTQGAQARSELMVASYAALLAHELGDRRPMNRLLAAVDPQSAVVTMEPAAGAYALLGVQQLMDQGHWQQAQTQLTVIGNNHRSLLLQRMRLAHARGSGNSALAMEQVRWLSVRRGMAYAEYGACGWCTQGYNVVASNLAALEGAEVLVQAGDLVGAQRELNAFDQVWSPERLPAHLSRRRAAVLSTFN